jgi:2-aminobenzoylacetyl-CoA thioesterase
MEVINTRGGEIVPGFHALGAVEVPCYLLEAPQAALFDAGFACVGPRYVRQAREVLGQEAPRWLFLTHAHFDHCGAVAYIKQAFPGLTVAASARGAEIVQRPGALSLIHKLNQEAARTVGAWHPDLLPAEEFRPFLVDQVLEEGQELDLGGNLSVRVLATPGHTWDFLSYYIPQRGILICSEAGGCAYPGGHVVSEFLVDYQGYLANIERFLTLGAKVLCQGHRLVYVGQDGVRQFLESSRQAAGRFRAWVEELLDQEHGQVEPVVARVKAQEYDPQPQPKQPEPAYLLNLRARVSHLAGLRGAPAAAKEQGA